MLCCLLTLLIQRSKHVMHSMLYVEAVDTKHIHTFLPITFLLFNRFSIRKKFWKAETEGFLMHSNAFNAMYVDTVDTKHLYTFLPITFLIFNQFSICKEFWKAETVAFLTIPSNTIYVDTVDKRQGSLMHSMLCMSTLSIQNTSTHFSL